MADGARRVVGWMRRAVSVSGVGLTVGLVGVLGLGLVGCASSGPAVGEEGPGMGSVIFVHPDGASSATWAAGRALLVGPDGMLEWDKLPAMGLYRGHLRDSLTGTSNGGATVHAFGVKVLSDAYGTSGGGESARPLVDEEGRSLSIAERALEEGLDVALVQTGTSTEPGTGCFLASVPRRDMHQAIAAQLIESGAAVMLGGGERYYLPEGVEGVHGEGVRTDGRNLVEEAREAGYRVVFTRDELMGLAPTGQPVLGLFAEDHTFNADPEEELRESGLPLYWEDAPTVGEMAAVALDVLERRRTRFLLVVEEEGTDNFGNANNASGVMEAMRRADEAFGVARRYVMSNPRTLLITAADSDGGGMRMLGLRDSDRRETVPASMRNGAPVDGVDGAGSAPFVSMPDRFGERHRFMIVWPTYSDVTGGVLVRGMGLNSDLITPNMDNTDVSELMRLTLFGAGGG